MECSSPSSAGRRDFKVLSEAAALAAVLMEVDLIETQVDSSPWPGEDFRYLTLTWFKSQH